MCMAPYNMSLSGHRAIAQGSRSPSSPNGSWTIYGLLNINKSTPILQVSNIHELGLVTCSLDSTIKITDISRCKVVHTVTAHRRGVHCFAHSKAFSLCASGGLERDILLWQGSTNRQVGEMTGHAASISHLAIDNRRCQVQTSADAAAAQGTTLHKSCHRELQHST